MFEPFPKMARLSRECVITEKIDGTNAQIVIAPGDSPEAEEMRPYVIAECPVSGMFMYAGSRTRFITPGKQTDNYGFAGWVKEHADDLWSLGEGRHFGEWWGHGIQRGYGMTEKVFSLFNVARWENAYKAKLDGHLDAGIPNCVRVVPTLYRGPFDTAAIEVEIEGLREWGSSAAPGFMDPEGIIVFHTAASIAFKKTVKDDDQRKGASDYAKGLQK